MDEGRLSVPKPGKPPLSPTNDYVFKGIFGVRERMGATIGLLRAFIPLEDEEIKTVQIADPALGRRFRGDKLSVLDLRVVTDRRDINVEMQNLGTPEFLDRVLHYLSRRMASHAASGEGYRGAPRTVSLVFMNFNMWEDGRHIHRFELLDPEAGLGYPNGPLIIMVELGKAPAEDDGTPEWPWIGFFRARTLEEFEALAGRSEAMAESVSRLVEMSASQRARMRAESREKFLWDQAALRRAGLAEGRAEGRAEGEAKGRAEGRMEGRMEGRTEGKVEVARRLLRRGMSVAEAADAVGLSEAEVTRLAAEASP